MEFKLEPLPSPFPVGTDIVPFTTTWGAGMLGMVEQMRNWLAYQLTPYINDVLAALLEADKAEHDRLVAIWQENMATLIARVEAAEASMGDNVALAVAAREAAEAARDLAEQFASDAQDVQDASVTGIFQDTDSELRKALDEQFAKLTDVADVMEVIANLGDTYANRQTNADEHAALGQRITNEANAASQALANGLATKAAKSVETEIAGRLAEPNLLALSKRVKKGYPEATAGFDRLMQGVLTPTTDTRVVILGSSSVEGLYTPIVTQQFAYRLANRAGARTLDTLDTVNSPPVAGGMKWWRGIGSTSADYMSASARRNAIGHIKPQYVIHQIGSNDYAGNVPLATYKANLAAAIAAIDAVSPNTVHVLIHQQGRRDVTPSIAWSQYGTAMREVVEAAPARRIFINMDEYFRAWDIPSANKGGIVGVDNIHMGALGHKYYADVLSGIMGLPNESDLFTGTMYQQIPTPGAATYSANAQLGDIQVVPAGYPRVFRIPVKLFVRPEGGWNIVTRFETTSGNPTNNIINGFSQVRMAPDPTVGHVEVNNTEILVGAYMGGFIRVEVTKEPGAGNCYVSGAADFSSMMVITENA